MSSVFYEFLIFAIPIIGALTLHEFAHAWVADRLGDPTPRSLGRVTLNPIAHMDPIGTVLIFLVHFGWGKPVPVDPSYLRQPRRDMLLIAAAGPFSNLASALIFGLTLRFTGTELSNYLIAFHILKAAVLINLVLAFFNLIPLPPLDGSKILACILPTPASRWYQAQWQYLSWGLLSIIALQHLADINILGPLIHTPTGLLFQLFTGFNLRS
jgi:Zn-dependent protease